MAYNNKFSDWEVACLIVDVYYKYFDSMNMTTYKYKHPDEWKAIEFYRDNINEDVKSKRFKHRGAKSIKDYGSSLYRAVLTKEAAKAWCEYREIPCPDRFTLSNDDWFKKEQKRLMDNRHKQNTPEPDVPTDDAIPPPEKIDTLVALKKIVTCICDYSDLDQFDSFPFQKELLCNWLKEDNKKFKMTFNSFTDALKVPLNNSNSDSHHPKDRNEKCNC